MNHVIPGSVSRLFSDGSGNHACGHAPRQEQRGHFVTFSITFQNCFVHLTDCHPAAILTICCPNVPKKTNQSRSNICAQHRGPTSDAAAAAARICMSFCRQRQLRARSVPQCQKLVTSHTDRPSPNDPRTDFTRNSEHAGSGGGLAASQGHSAAKAGGEKDIIRGHCVCVSRIQVTSN